MRRARGVERGALAITAATAAALLAGCADHDRSPDRTVAAQAIPTKDDVVRGGFGGLALLIATLAALSFLPGTGG